MPTFDLRDPHDLDNFKPLAHFQVLSVMFFPNDLYAREALMARILKETGSGKARRNPLPGLGDAENIDKKIRAGAITGLITLIQLQLMQRGKSPSLNNAIKIALDIMPEWTSFDRAGMPRPPSDVYYGRNRDTLFNNLRDFAKARFLWAAFVHLEEYNQGDSAWLESVDRLPVLLGYAECFASLYRDMPAVDRNNPPKTVFNRRWKFRTPRSGEYRPKVCALPLKQSWKSIITSGSLLRR